MGVLAASWSLLFVIVLLHIPSGNALLLQTQFPVQNEFDGLVEATKLTFKPLADGDTSYACSAERKRFVPNAGFDGRLPTVTVVVPTYRTRHDFHGLMNHSFFTQDYPTSKLDLLVYDDDSTQESPLASYWKVHPRVTYIRHAKRHFIGWKRNWLLQHAKGDIIVHFDDDDFYNTHYVRYMVEYLLSHSSAGVKLVKMGGWYHVMPENSMAKIQRKGEDRFVSVCMEYPNTGFGFAWAYFRSVGSQCQFSNKWAGEEVEFLNCLQGTGGMNSIHQIGDTGSQLIKIDVCTGLTSLVPRGRPWIPKSTLKSLYGQDSWQALYKLGLAHIKASWCVGKWKANDERLARIAQGGHK